MYNIFLFL